MIKFIKNIHHAASGKLLNLLLLFLVGLLISGCDQDLAPIEADDFGYPKVTVYAKGENVSGEEENQLSDWISTGYKYNGDQIVIMAYNPTYSYGGSQPPQKYTWNPWLCNGESDICVAMYDSPRCRLSTSSCAEDSECTAQKEDWCTNPNDKYESISNAPCYLAQGEGLYLLITYPDGDIENPNTYDNVNRLPSTGDLYTKSLWDSPDSGAEMYNNGSEAKGFSGELAPNATYSTDSDSGVTTETPSSLSQSDYLDGRAYFKILDRYYDDNSGYQYAVMKRGFDSVTPPPIASVIDFVTETMDETSETLYKGIIENSEYRASVKALLVLYIIVHGILYIGGASDMTQNELISLFIKLTIVIQLLTGEDSWTLFNNYFFQFFTTGLDEMISITTSNIDQSNNGFTFFDTLLGLLFSYETSMKIQALIWSFPSGFVVTFIIYAGFALFTIAIGKAVMVYLLAYMAISLLIIVSPIFICFMLFQQTRSLFETWIDAFANYFLQAVLVMAALNLMGQIIVDQIYMILGFKACFEDNPMFTIGGWCFSKSWFICSDFSTGLVSTEVPGYGYNYTTSIDCDASSGYQCPDKSKYCEPFECIDDRYPDLPFLDPEIEKEHDLIENFKSPNSLSIPMLYESSVLLLMCYLMMKFNDVVPGLGKGMVKGGSAGPTALGQTASSSMGDFKSAISGMKNGVLKMATGSSQLDREIYRRKLLNSGVNAIRGGISTIGSATMGLAKGAAKAVDEAASKAYNNSGKLKPLLYPVKKLKQTAVLGAKATGFILKGGFIGASILKDTLIQPGTFMIGTPEQIQARKNAVKNAKAYNRQNDAAEGKEISLSYKEQLTKMMQDKTGITRFNERVANFDEKYMREDKHGNKEFIFRAAGGAMRRGVGRALYKTETGKAIYDGTIRLGDSIKEEYRARFTQQGRIDREAARRKDNQIQALATQYQQDAPARNRADRQDLLASQALENHCKNLNLDKELLLKMSQENQLKYIQRAYAELPEYLRSSVAAQTSFDMLKAQLETDRIVRTKRDIDPSIIANEAYNSLDINKGTFNSLDTKGQLAALEKGLRESDLTGPGAADAYRAYQYLKQRAESQLTQEKETLKEQKRQQSFIYKAGEAASSMKRGFGQAGRGIQRIGQKGIHGVQHGMNRLANLRMQDFTLKNAAIGTASLTYGAIKLAAKPITIPAGMAYRAAKQSFSDSLDKRGIKIDFSMGFTRSATFSYSMKVAHLEREGTARDKQLIDYKQKYDKDQLKVSYKNADLLLKESCFALGITKAALDTMPAEERKAYIDKAFNSTIDMDASRDFERYKAYRAAQAVIEYHDKQDAKDLTAKDQKKLVIGELNKKEADRKQMIADKKRSDQEGVARQQAKEQRNIEQIRESNTAALSKTLKIDHNEFMLMDQASQSKYLSRAYAALPQDQKDAELNKLYREIRDDIAKNGAIEREATKISGNLAALGLTREQLKALSPEERLAAIEKSFKDVDLEVNGGKKVAAYEDLKQKAQRDADNFKREEEAKGTLSYKAIDATIKAGEAIGSAASSVGNLAKSAATRAKNIAKSTQDSLANTKSLIFGGTLKLQGEKTTAEEMAEINYLPTAKTVNTDNAGQLFTDACSTLNIDSTTLHSLSKERGLEYITEKLNEKSLDITKGNELRYNSDEFMKVSTLSQAHANLRAILERDLAEDPLVTAQKQRESDISAYESNYENSRAKASYAAKYNETDHSIDPIESGKALGISKNLLDLVDDKEVRAEMLQEKAAATLGISESELKEFNSLSNEKEKLAILDRSLMNNAIEANDTTAHAYNVLRETLGEVQSNSIKGNLITKEVGVELGMDGKLLDLIDQEKMRVEAISDRAAEIILLENAEAFKALGRNEQLAMIDNALKDDSIDLSIKENQLAYRTLKEIAETNVPPSNNPFDDNYVDSETRASKPKILDEPITDEAPLAKPSPFKDNKIELERNKDKETLFDEPEPLPRKKKADLFGDDEIDVTLKPTPSNLFEEPEAPKEQRSAPVKRTKLDSNEGPLENIPDPIKQSDSKKDVANPLERKETDNNPLENAKPSIFEAETPELKKVDLEKQATKNIFDDPEPLPTKKKADLFEEPETPKEQRGSSLKRTKLDGNDEGPL